MYTMRSQSGFTLVEMIVSLAIFAIVVTISVGALLVLVGTNKQLQGEQAVMTNLSFALDSMTREIRTGSDYYCFLNSNSNNITSGGSSLDAALKDQGTGKQTVADCNGGGDANYHGLAFIEGGDSISSSAGENRIVYFYDKAAKTIMRRVGSGSPLSIVSDNLVIEDFDFFVSGAIPATPSATANNRQPTVTIYIKATEKGKSTDKPYYIQTTITQRTLDV